jgi:hypothetical protein
MHRTSQGTLHPLELQDIPQRSSAENPNSQTAPSTTPNNKKQPKVLKSYQIAKPTPNQPSRTTTLPNSHSNNYYPASSSAQNRPKKPAKYYNLQNKAN